MSSHNAGKQVGNQQLLSNSTPDQFRNLVLDHLYHNCNSRTARAFARDSAVRHLDADGDEILPDGANASSTIHIDETLRLAEIRQEIRMHILSGRVDEATALLNEHFPSVLGEVPSNAATARPPLKPTSSNSNVAVYVPPTSFEPSHLSLNLRILAFSEASRTVPLEYPPHPQQSTASPHWSASQPIKSPVHERDDPEAKQTDLLLRAQKLYTAANILETPIARAHYLNELGNVGGLLAYTHPEKSPMAKYLSQERREAIAEQINNAILHSIGRPVISNLELYARQTTVLWAFLSNDPKLRPSGKRPAGIVLPPADMEQDDDPPPVKSGADKDVLETVPPFDLHLFLDSKV